MSDLKNTSFKKSLVSLRIYSICLAIKPFQPKPSKPFSTFFFYFWLSNTSYFSAAETSHLRLGASRALVKLTQHAKYVNQLTVPKFEKLGITLQDTCFYVRQEFAESLMKGLHTEQIHSRYYALLFMCAHEPEAALVKQVKGFIQKKLSSIQSKQGDANVLDSALIRLIHLLAHHPDFSEAVEDLEVLAQYFRFYLACVATSDNVEIGRAHV